MSFLRTTALRATRVAPSTGVRIIRPLSTSPFLNKSITESVKNAAKAVDHTAANAALKGLEAAEHVRDKVVGSHDTTTQQAGEVVGKAKEAGGEAVGAAQEYTGRAKGKVNEYTGSATGAKEQAKGAVKGKASEVAGQAEKAYERDL